VSGFVAHASVAMRERRRQAIPNFAASKRPK
jgi:hypothetical protein